MGAIQPHLFRMVPSQRNGWATDKKKIKLVECPSQNHSSCVQKAYLQNIWTFVDIDQLSCTIVLIFSGATQTTQFDNSTIIPSQGPKTVLNSVISPGTVHQFYSMDNCCSNFFHFPSLWEQFCLLCKQISIIFC